MSYGGLHYKALLFIIRRHNETYKATRTERRHGVPKSGVTLLLIRYDILSRNMRLDPIRQAGRNVED